MSISNAISFCPEKVIPIKTKISEKHQYSHAVRYNRKKQIREGRVKNVRISDITFQSFNVSFDIDYAPLYVTVNIYDNSGILTTYFLDTITGYNKTIDNLEPSHSYKVNIIAKYQSGNSISLIEPLFVNTAHIIKSSYFGSIDKNSIVLIIQQDPENYLLYTNYEYKIINITNDTHKTIYSGSSQNIKISFDSLTENTLYTFRIETYMKGRLLKYAYKLLRERTL